MSSHLHTSAATGTGHLSTFHHQRSGACSDCAAARLALSPRLACFDQARQRQLPAASQSDGRQRAAMRCSQSRLLSVRGPPPDAHCSAQGGLTETGIDKGRTMAQPEALRLLRELQNRPENKVMPRWAAWHLDRRSRVCAGPRPGAEGQWLPSRLRKRCVRDGDV